jgi:hypothetical protein
MCGHGGDRKFLTGRRFERLLELPGQPERGQRSLPTAADDPPRQHDRCSRLSPVSTLSFRTDAKGWRSYCCWPTMWPYTEPKRPRSCHDRMSIVTMMRCLYGTQVNNGGLALACLALRRQRVALGCGLQQVVLQHQICNQSLQSRVLVAQMPEFFCFN